MIMEKITSRKTLDVHKNGIQFLLQGFENADNLSRVVEISLMQSGDAIDFPEEKVSAWMYVTVPGEKEPDIQECKIEGNKIVYEVPKISAPGIATMQIKLIEHDINGVAVVLASPKFAVEVSESGMGDDGEELKEKFTDIEKLIAEAKRAYDERIVRIDLDEDGIFRAYYADDSIVYESDALRNMYSNEANALYYKQLAEAFAEKAETSATRSEEVLDEVVKHGVYTLFSVDFETGNLQYVSPKYNFDINEETGELEAKGEVYTFEENIQDIVDEWLKSKGKAIDDYQEKTDTNTTDITALKSTSTSHSKSISELETTTAGHTTKISTLEGKVGTLEVSASQWDVEENIGSIIDAKRMSLDAGPSGDPVSFEFLAINDGEIYLKFHWYVSASGKAGQIEKAYYTISIGRKGPNDTDYTYTAQVGRTENYLPPGESISKYQTPVIHVKRGDRVRFEIGATLRHTGTYGSNECEASEIDLFANIATPYRYKEWDMTSTDFEYIKDDYEYYDEGDV
jgi:hypothetical protein